MKRSLPKILLMITLVIACGSREAKAESESTPTLREGFATREEVEHGSISFGLETAQVQSVTGSLLIYGPKIGVDYDLGRGFSVSPNLLLLGSGSTFTTSGLYGLLRYSVLGGEAVRHNSASFNGKSVYDEFVTSSSRLSVGLGLEQLFLNGTANVFPAAGPTFEIAYAFWTVGHHLEFHSRYSNLSVNSSNLSSISLGLSVLIGL